MDPAVLREDMVDGLEHGMDVAESVALAMRTVPRHEFVEDAPYQNRASKFEGSTVLSPANVARLLTALSAEPDEDVLIVGAGVGYTAALVAEIVGDTHVHAVDIDRRLVYAARSNLQSVGSAAVLVDCRDGADGLSEYAPFDRILVEAAAIEPPKRLVSQLEPDGRLVFPMGGPKQTLVSVDAAGEVVEKHGPVAFDPLLVEGEQRSGPVRNRTVREDAEFSESGYFAPSGWEQEWIDWDERLSGRQRRYER
ncbi:protein-L-isoaspartate O-methyltransferase [Halogeometricum borinquense]|uniref:protein-L-isoaspartate(D-aspartate) O-methyltransferase n=1 Tax=Halogeometricum borinquense TaxID=60847 RepID=A0A6C0UDG7_9EURY|nr:protein-L-isoaspartate O-methyltransferase [Halogeometricum borinquense]QIB73177.1 protein-L-isoaspartate O-methyltransferase [Halogeometricum borinquense]QIQ77427.1 protein-L-isoaspartate O-methyltransferase [Halogeometricum borinquense]